MPQQTYLYFIRLSALEECLPLARARAFLSTEERAYTANIKADSRLREFIYGRFLIRQCLSQTLNTSIKSLTLKKEKSGKLVLAKAYKKTCHFNLSHSQDYLAFCYSHEQPVGIDIECPREGTEVLDIAKRFFAKAEYDAILALAEQDRRAYFYRTWVKKEAVLKALGVGIAAGLDQLDTTCIHEQVLSHISIDNNTPAFMLQSWPLEEPACQADSFFAAAALGQLGEVVIHNTEQTLLHMLKI